MPVTRREILKAGTAAGALLIAKPFGALAQGLGPRPFETSRASRLFPGTWLAHADLHNHTLMSDGDGTPEAAFASLRSAGLDVAALTDHATIGMDIPGMSSCGECASLTGMNETKWAQAGEIADSHYEPERFVAIRGFEWSSPTLGHVNVWFSEKWVDPLHTAGVSTGEGIGQFLHTESDKTFPSGLSEPLDAFIRMAPTSGTTMQPFYEWLKSNPDTPVLGGGLDGIAGFNHPGRETGRFGYFSFEPDLRDRLVSCEVFNRTEDYLFEGTDQGVGSPINECLNAGWKVGLLGVTDEHGTDWGYPDGKGRTGLWVNSLTRDDVREALLARRFFSTRLKGLRLDASANGVRMGSELAHGSGPVTFKLDIDRGRQWWGRRLNVQVLQSGTHMPEIIANHEIRVPTGGQPVVAFTTPVDAINGGWVVLRVTDPSEPADERATGSFASLGNAVAYASPFFLVPPA